MLDPKKTADAWKQEVEYFRELYIIQYEANVEAMADIKHLKARVQYLEHGLKVIGHRQEPANIGEMVGGRTDINQPAFGYLLACEHVIADAQRLLKGGD